MVFKNLADYHLWAGWKFREILNDFDSDLFIKDVNGRSVRSIVQHIVLSLETCFYFLEDEKDKSVFERAKILPRQELLKRWEVLDTRLSSAIEEIPQDRFTVTHIQDEPFEVDVVDFFLQYLLHTAHHRGQLAAVLSDLGIDAPGTDYLMFFGENI